MKKREKEINLFTCKMVAERLGVDDSMVRRMAKKKSINGHKVGFSWVFTEKDIVEFEKAYRRRRTKRDGIESDIDG